MTKSLKIVGDIKILDNTVQINSETLNVFENFSEITVQEIELAKSDANISINFGGIASDATLLIILPSYDSAVASNYLTCKINGGSEVFNIGKMLVLSGYSTYGVDSITLTNPDTVYAVGVKVYICK